jgi:hypothetical protein
MISVGLTMEHVRSPDERLEIESVGKIYDLLFTALAHILAIPSGTTSPNERTAGTSTGLSPM